MVRAMTTNNTGVTPPDAATEAYALLAHADHLEQEIDALKGERSRAGHYADRRDEHGTTIKRAEVISNLAVAEAVDRLRLAVERWDGVRTSHSREIFLAAQEGVTRR